MRDAASVCFEVGGESGPTQKAVGAGEEKLRGGDRDVTGSGASCFSYWNSGLSDSASALRAAAPKVSSQRVRPLPDGIGVAGFGGALQVFG